MGRFQPPTLVTQFQRPRALRKGKGLGLKMKNGIWPELDNGVSGSRTADLS